MDSWVKQEPAGRRTKLPLQRPWELDIVLGGPRSLEAHRDMPGAVCCRRRITAPSGPAERPPIRRRRRNQLSHRRRPIVSCKRRRLNVAEDRAIAAEVRRAHSANARRHIVMEIIQTDIRRRTRGTSNGSKQSTALGC